MRVPRRQRLPLVPLLRAYTGPGLLNSEELTRLPGLGSRFRAVLAARGEFLNEAFVDGATEGEFQTALGRFYSECVLPPLHAETLCRRAGVVRHALSHLLRCRDPLPYKADRCLNPDGPYAVAGLGPSFWSALFQGLDPKRNAGWTPAIVAGLSRLGLTETQPGDGPAAFYAAILTAHAPIRSLEPSLSALHIDHFLSRVATMHGRDLWSSAERPETASGATDLAGAIGQTRAASPLRQSLKDRGQALHDARQLAELGLATRDGPTLGAALAVVDSIGAQRSSLRWKANSEALTLWVDRLWEADDPYEVLEIFWRADPIPHAGLWLPAAVLHLRDPRRFQPWNEVIRQGYAAFDDSLDRSAPAWEQYRLFNEGVAWLCVQQSFHAVEAPTVFAALASGTLPLDGGPACASASAGKENGRKHGTQRSAASQFNGFCDDTFRFLAELGQNNRRQWMEQERDRYRFAVREPLVELCRALAEQYIRPVLQGAYGWELESAPRAGRALTSVVKNDYGRTVPYQTALWITFYRRQSGRGTDMQFFVRLDETGLRYGLRLAHTVGEAGDLLRQNVAEQGDLLYQALRETSALTECRFGDADDLTAGHVLASPEELRAWVDGKSLMVWKALATNNPLLSAEDLVGEIILTFDRLLPVYACAVERGPVALLARLAGVAPAPPRFSEADFRRSTFLDEDWLRRARHLLDLKRQLILQGVPGTGKTHVAQGLARLLTGGREDAYRLVQFHPAFSYEEFVEGIKVRTVEVNGRNDVTYPVEDGLLCAFAAAAAREPGQPFVLLIDEINRGNLPRIFGELLYLLEYRGQSVSLPYSKRAFRLPANLYLIGTMNAADRSVALVDQALRRRFSFLDMPPDETVLEAWLRDHPPAAGAEFATEVVTLFERLNTQLRADLGPQYQIGHSYFMVPELDPTRLQVVWEHHVLPLLEEYFHGHPARAAAYDLEKLLRGDRGRCGRRKRRASAV
jgi:MoxR-like ATPase